MKTQSFVDDTVEICCLLKITELCLRPRFIERVKFFAKFGVYFLGAGEVIKYVSECCSSGVAACDDDKTRIAI
jgi:hypothetical protein